MLYILDLPLLQFISQAKSAYILFLQRLKSRLLVFTDASEVSYLLARNRVRGLKLINDIYCGCKLIFSISTVQSLYRGTPHQLKSFLRPFLPAYSNNWYIRGDLDLYQFFLILSSKHAQFVVLRSYIDLPYLSTSDDIDILIASTSLHYLTPLVTHKPGNYRLDIYTDTYTQGFSYGETSYYPYRLAHLILSERTWHNQIVPIPNPLHYLNSLIYHVLFHKSNSIDLNFTFTHRNKTPKDYLQLITEAATNANVTIEFNSVNDLYTYLLKCFWLPSLDTIRYFAKNNDLIRALLPDVRLDPADGELMVFLIRSYALTHTNCIDKISKYIADHNLSILCSKELSPEQKFIAKTQFRGGNWTRGPYPSDGGDPVYLIICFDYHPLPSSSSYLQDYPFSLNQNTYIKRTLRQSINNEFLYHKHANFIHSSDDELEAWSYLEALLSPFEYSRMLKRVTALRTTYKTDYPVITMLDSDRTRSKIELINFDNKLAIKKTFRDDSLTFFEKELFVYKNFSLLNDSIPSLLSYGENFLILPYFTDQLKGLNFHELRLVLGQYRHDIRSIIKFFYSQNCALVNFVPGNLILTESNKLLVIDFEFVHFYKNKPSSLSQSYDIIGIPENFDGNLPRGFNRHLYNYKFTWQHLIGAWPK